MTALELVIHPACKRALFRGQYKGDTLTPALFAKVKGVYLAVFVPYSIIRRDRRNGLSAATRDGGEV